MSGSDVGSNNSSSNATDGEEVVQFECRICKQLCTAAEKDSHRAMHSRQKRKRAPSPGQSEVPTLFHQITMISPSIPVSAEMERREASRGAEKELAKKKAEKRAKSGKRRSKKNYNQDLEWERSSGS